MKRVFTLTLVLTCVSAFADMAFKIKSYARAGAVFARTTPDAGFVTVHPAGKAVVAFSQLPAFTFTATVPYLVYSTGAQEKLVMNSSLIAMLVEGSDLPPITGSGRSTIYQFARYLAATHTTISQFPLAQKSWPKVIAKSAAKAQLLVIDGSGQSAVLMFDASGTPYVLNTPYAVASSVEPSSLNYVIGQLDSALAYYDDVFAKTRAVTASYVATRDAYRSARDNSVGAFYSEVVTLQSISDEYWRRAGENTLLLSWLPSWYDYLASQKKLRDSHYDLFTQFDKSARITANYAESCYGQYTSFLSRRNYPMASYWLDVFSDSVTRAKSYRATAASYFDAAVEVQRNGEAFYQRYVVTGTNQYNGNAIKMSSLVNQAQGVVARRDYWKTYAEYYAYQVDGYNKAIAINLAAGSVERQKQLVAETYQNVAKNFGAESVAAYAARDDKSGSPNVILSYLGGDAKYRGATFFSVGEGRVEWQSGSTHHIFYFDTQNQTQAGVCGIRVDDPSSRLMTAIEIPRAPVFLTYVKAFFGGGLSDAQVAATIQNNYNPAQPDEVCPSVGL